MNIRKYVSRSSQARDSQPSIQNSQTYSALSTESNMQNFIAFSILRNRYVRLRKAVQKVNHFAVNRIAFKPHSENGLRDPPSTSEEFISNFIRCQKQKIASKLSQPIESNEELLKYIQSKTRTGRPDDTSFGNAASTANSGSNTSDMRMSKTQKRTIIPVESPEKEPSKEKMKESLFRKTHEFHSRQISQPDSSPRKIDGTSERGNYNSGNVQMRLRKTPNSKTIVKVDQQTLDEAPQMTQSERKNKPLLLHELKSLGHIKSESYVVMEYPSGQLVLNYRSKQSLEIASLTKIMTCYLIIKLSEELKRNIFEETFDVREYVEYSTGTTAELIHGDFYTIEQLLYALMLPSGNDAALSLADWAGGLIDPKSDHKQNIKVFVKQMNLKCKQLGLKDLRFGNPHGLPHKDTRATAHDISILCLKCLEIPLFCKIIATQEYRTMIKTIDGLEREVLWENTNKLLRREGFMGIKTGITVTAGPCLASAYKFRDKIYVMVLLRANKVSRRFTETRKVLYYVLRTLHQTTLTQKQVSILQDLRRNKRQLDSDNSQDQAEFTYSKECIEEYAKRKKILKYEL